MRHPAALALVALLPVLQARGLHAQGQPQAPIVGKGQDNAAGGTLNTWDFGASDVTIKQTLNELWVLDPFTGASPMVLAFSLADLTAEPRRIVIELPAQNAGSAVLGIAEIPHGEFQGKNLILIEANFGSSDAPLPLLGIYGDDGKIDPTNPFFPVDGVDPAARLGPIDVSPTEEEIAVYDSENHAVYILDFGFSRTKGPFPVLGFPTFFTGPWLFDGGPRAAGVGIAFNGPDRLLASSAFRTLFECSFVLEYDLTADGAYAGRAMDLSAAAASPLEPDVAFVCLDAGKVGADDLLFAVNFSDESVYSFQLVFGEHPPPVNADCAIAAGDAYSVSWSLPPGLTADAFHVIENGVDVAVLGPLETTFSFPLPLSGKTFIEVFSEKGGVLSGIRSVCQLENTQRPPLEGVVFDATQIDNLGALFGIAVTKLPASPADFRVFVLGSDSNAIESFDYKLDVQEVIPLTPRVVSQGNNLAALGLALVNIQGVQHFAVLDPDGPLGNEIPSASFHPASGPQRGTTAQRVDPIDLNALSPIPFLFDWDAADDSTFIAAGTITTQPAGTQDYVLVKIAFDGTSLTGTRMVTIPHRVLTPFPDEELSGVGVAVLPSGNLLVAGSDTFSQTYTDALLTTPFTDDPATAVRIVGYAQGLVALNQFFGFGPGFGPREFYGLEVAHFPPAVEGEAGVGVTYLTANHVTVIENPTARQTLTQGFPALVHSANKCSQPDLAAEQLAESVFDVPAGQQVTTPSWSPVFDAPGTIDYFVYVANTSPEASERLGLEVLLDDVLVAEASQDVLIDAGRYFRRMLPGRSEVKVQLRVENKGTAAAQVKVIAGAMAVGASVAPPVFKRGDCDGNGAEAITDAIFGLNWLFQSGTPPGCADACDTDDNAIADVTDMVIILNNLFRSGAPPVAPGPEVCGVDPTGDDTFDPCVYPDDACQ